MSSLSLLNQGRSCLLQNRPRHPWVLVSGEGPYASDDEGRRYLDFASGAMGNLLGHGHPRFARVLAELGRGVVAAAARGYHRPQVELAAQLADLSFADRVLLCPDAREARAAAVALVAEYRRLREETRDEIIVPSLDEVEEPVRIVVAAAKLRRVRYGEAAAVAEVLTNRTTAILVAPLALAGGVVLPKKRYLEDLRALADAARVPLVIDESRVPIGRTGTMFAYEGSGVRPDMLILGHSLAGGEPLGAVLLREELARGAATGLAGFSLGGAPVQTAMALETVRALASDGLLDSCVRVGRYLGNQLDALRKRSPLVVAVSGVGLLYSIQLATGADEIALGCQQRGVLLGQAGRDTLLVQPPLTIQRSHVRAFLGVLREVLADQGGLPADSGDERGARGRDGEE